MSIIQPISFQGKFIKADKFKGESAKFVNDVINKKSENISNRDILKKLPFDVEIKRKNKSHKAIHPEITFYIDYKQFWGKQSYYVEHGSDYAIKSIRTWFNGFVDFMEKNKDKTRLTSKEENDRIYDFLRNFGKIKHYKPLQRH